MTSRAAAGSISGTSPSRREFLQASLTVGGALVLGLHLPLASGAAAKQKQEPFAPNAFIRIDSQGAVTFIIPQAEMGQGIFTSIAMILAEELDVAWERVQVEAAPPSDKLYGNPTFGIQVTGNSNSIRAFWMPLRKAGAATRAILVEAAARRWNVDKNACRAANGEVLHTTSGRKLAYGDLLSDASRLVPPKDPTLKAPGS